MKPKYKHKNKFEKHKRASIIPNYWWDGLAKGESGVWLNGSKRSKTKKLERRRVHKTERQLSKIEIRNS